MTIRIEEAKGPSGYMCLGVLASQNLQSGGKPPHSRGDLAGFFEIVTAVRLVGPWGRLGLTHDSLEVEDYKSWLERKIHKIDQNHSFICVNVFSCVIQLYLQQ